MRKKYAALLTFAFSLFLAQPAFANSISKSIFVTGTKAMLNDALTGILILVPIAAAAMIAWLSYLKKGLQEPAEIAQKDKLIKKIMIAAVIAFGSSTIVKIVLSYYGFKPEGI